MTIQFATQAIRLMNQGITCIPYIDKRPHVLGWKQIRSVTQEQIMHWEDAGLWQNIGLLCGSASGNIVVIDFDGLAGYEMFKEKFPDLVYTKTVVSGSGEGMHVYFKVDLLPDSVAVKRIVIEGGELINVEIKSEGDAVAIPPSIHPVTKQPYKVAIDLPMLVVPDLTHVIAWAKSLKPDFEKDWQKPKDIPTTPSGDLNPKLLEAVERYFLSLPHKISDEWINCSCPDGGKHKHGDENYSFGYNPAIGLGNCFGCGNMNLKVLLPLIGMDARDYGGIYERKEDATPPQLDRMPTTAIAGEPIPPAATHAPTGAGIPVVKRSSRLTHYINRLMDYDMPIEHPPVMFPLKALHSYGGMAQILKPGKLIGIVGISGGGKTSLMETMVDGFLNYHAPSLVWSPEWTADEFIERSVQRYGGPSASEVYMHETFIWEKQNGIKNGVGKEMSIARVEAAKRSIRLLRQWEDEVGYLNMPFLTVGYLKTAIANTLATIDFKPRVLVIDYLQLLHALESDHGVTMYSLIMQIKTVCQMFNLVGVIASQVTKMDTKGLIKGKKTELLDATSARYVNDDAFNLFITINPEHDSFGQKEPYVILNIAKNSMGKQGKARVGVNWSRLSFEEELHSNQNNLDGKPEDKTKEEDDDAGY